MKVIQTPISVTAYRFATRLGLIGPCLADALRGSGNLRSPQWHAAVAAVPRHLLIPPDPDIQTSALVRRLLRHALHDPGAPVLTMEDVEAIARRVLAENTKD